MNIKKHIPNLITLGNLFCGAVATIYAVKADFEIVAILVVLGIVLDFFDGFFARILNVTGELGKQLDSLADMVTSGVVPGIVMFQLLNGNFFSVDALTFSIKGHQYLPYVGLLITLAACYRLANFNIDERQTDSFIGLPTPAMSLFIIALPSIPMYTENQFFIDLIQNEYFLVAVTLILSFLMNAEIPLFSLKFKSFGLKENLLKYVYLVLSLVLLVVLGVIAIPLVIILYVILSVANNMIGKKA